MLGCTRTILLTALPYLILHVDYICLACHVMWVPRTMYSVLRSNHSSLNLCTIIIISLYFVLTVAVGSAVQLHMVCNHEHGCAFAPYVKHAGTCVVQLQKKNVCLVVFLCIFVCIYSLNFVCVCSLLKYLVCMHVAHIDMILKKVKKKVYNLKVNSCGSATSIFVVAYMQNTHFSCAAFVL